MSGKFLAIDCGNSRIKATVLDAAGNVTERSVYPYNEVDTLIDRIGEGDINEAAMASVHALDTRLVESIRNLMGDGFLLITPHTPLGIGIVYSDPSRLGIDRKVAAVGASVLFPGERVLVIDSGTALTKDFIGPEGEFQSGSISPGIAMRFESLNRGTHLLPRPELPKDIDDVKGNSTEGCILLGVLGGILDEIGMTVACGLKEGLDRVVLCGGDGEWICKNLKRRFGYPNIEYQYIPDLLAVGMREIFRRQS